MQKTASRIAFYALSVLLTVSALPADRPDTRSVLGRVVDKRGNPLAGAAVQLENTRNQAIASYITHADGQYQFHQLDRDVDFELTAKYKKWWSKRKILSKFNAATHAKIDLVIPID